jgi:hypothetical protein
MCRYSMSKNLLHRLGGILFLAIAAGAAWFGIHRPLQSAEAGIDVVRWMPKITVLIGMSAVFGLFFLLTGNRHPYRDVARQTLTPVGWVLCGIVAVVALGGYFWMDQTLRGMGYRY